MPWPSLGRLSMPLCAAAALAAALTGGPGAVGVPDDGRPENRLGENGLPHDSFPHDGGTRGTARDPVRGTVREDTGLRQAPARDSAVHSAVGRGEPVTVLCAAEGAHGSAWYLVHTDHFAWAPARDIAVNGPPPEWC